MTYIKTTDEFSISKLLFKPIVDFDCLTITKDDLKKWYGEVKDSIDF